MHSPSRILVFQTAFLGDVILTLPLLQVIHREFPAAEIDVVTNPAAAELLRNHPALHRTIPYDKRGTQRGVGGMWFLASELRRRNYDIALVLHRSFRSALVTALAGIPARVAFGTSAGRFLYTDLVPYDEHAHEVERNFSFLKIFGIPRPHKELPSLYPSNDDVAKVTTFLFVNHIGKEEPLVAIAPGSVWNTKRWPAERFAGLVRMLIRGGKKVVLLGGGEDERLCREIAESVGSSGVYLSAGKLTILQSAELIRRCELIVTNDSAPMHLAVAMRTPVVAIFGATIPAFGFAPYGEKDIVVQTEGLSCRPCSIHGGDKCPIGTFECMWKISPETVLLKTAEIV